MESLAVVLGIIWLFLFIKNAKETGPWYGVALPLLHFFLVLLFALIPCLIITEFVSWSPLALLLSVAFFIQIWSLFLFG